MFSLMSLPLSVQLQLRRASVLDAKQDDSNAPVTPGARSDEEEFPMPEDDDMANIPFDEEEAPQAGRASSLNLSISRDDSAGVTAEVGGLDVSHEDSVKSDRRRKRVSDRKRMRKRRKVVVDNDETELSNAHIKSMLADTNDIVMQNVVHPATWVPGQEPHFTRTDEDLLFEHLSYEKLLTRPALGDDGQLTPELLKLWARSTAPILGKPFAYKKRKQTEEEEEESDVESVEGVRGHRASEGADDEHRHAMEDEGEFPLAEDQEEWPQDDGVAMPFDEEEPPQPADDSGFGKDMEGMSKSPLAISAFVFVSLSIPHLFHFCRSGQSAV